MKKRIPMQLFINGGQVGNNATFAETAESPEAAREACEAFYVAEGFSEVTATIEMARQWPSGFYVSPEVPTVIVRCQK